MNKIKIALITLLISNVLVSCNSRNNDNYWGKVSTVYNQNNRP